MFGCICIDALFGSHNASFSFIVQKLPLKNLMLVQNSLEKILSHLRKSLEKIVNYPNKSLEKVYY